MMPGDGKVYRLKKNSIASMAGCTPHALVHILSRRNTMLACALVGRSETYVHAEDHQIEEASDLRYRGGVVVDDRGVADEPEAESRIEKIDRARKSYVVVVPRPKRGSDEKIPVGTLVYDAGNTPLYLRDNEQAMKAGRGMMLVTLDPKGRGMVLNPDVEAVRLCDADGWIEHDGSECPIPSGLFVHLRTGDFDTERDGMGPYLSDTLVWETDRRGRIGPVTHYKIAKQVTVAHHEDDEAKRVDPATVETLMKTESKPPFGIPVASADMLKAEKVEPIVEKQDEAEAAKPAADDLPPLFVEIGGVYVLKETITVDLVDRPAGTLLTSPTPHKEFLADMQQPGFVSGILGVNFVDSIGLRFGVPYSAIMPCDAEGWVEWKGGEMPVEGTTPVECKLRDLSAGPVGILPAGEWRWSASKPDDLSYNSDIVAFRIVPPEQKPRDTSAPLGTDGETANRTEGDQEFAKAIDSVLTELSAIDRAGSREHAVRAVAHDVFVNTVAPHGDFRACAELAFDAGEAFVVESERRLQKIVEKVKNENSNPA